MTIGDRAVLRRWERWPFSIEVRELESSDMKRNTQIAWLFLLGSVAVAAMIFGWVL